MQLATEWPLGADNEGENGADDYEQEAYVTIHDTRQGPALRRTIAVAFSVSASPRPHRTDHRSRRQYSLTDANASGRVRSWILITRLSVALTGSELRPTR